MLIWCAWCFRNVLLDGLVFSLLLVRGVNMEFRTLKANEIDVRVGQVTSKGAILLLYKDARCDMNILDETVGAENWQREHYEVKGNMFCRVGIKCANEWVFKSDCGTESNTEKEKGEASDSFKRACVNWGIGRELYTAPTILVKTETEKDGNRYKLKDQYAFYGCRVADIKYNDAREIVSVKIVNRKGEVIYGK